MTSVDSKALVTQDQPLWFKDAVIYELHVRAFYDTDGDGIGDFRGLTRKLDYLQDLGVTAIWLLPFYPSPLKDDGYDIADYSNIHPSYGAMRDFRAFLREANRRGVHVITELVVNHTSDQHPWFQRARHAPPGSRYRDFYVWSDTTERYKDTRIIFKDFENSNWDWDPVAQAYYWHRFYKHQPDLNYRNPSVRREVMRVMDYYFSLGVSGLRLDAVPYLFEREGTTCENLPETHHFLKELRRHVDSKYQNRLLLAEANQWPEDSVDYFGSGDECNMAFHFPVMPRMFMAVRMEDRYPIVDILQQTPPIPENCQWAMFLRNHDELTLEMVTDEERDYMYRLYAHDPQMRINLGIRRRLAPLLNNDRNKIELLNSLLFSLPGTPVLYYGDEIGMGDNYYLGDRNAVRTPMQWSADRNAGFSTANSQKLYLPVIIDPEYHYEAVNVDNQQNNPDSLLWWMKRIISLRKRHKALARGSLEFRNGANRKVLSFIRRYQDECMLVVANLSRRVQHTSLNLHDFAGMVPVEVFGQSEFPPVGEEPYFFSLAPYGFYWFSLSLPSPNGANPALPSGEAVVPTLMVSGAWHELFGPQVRASLTGVLSGYIRARRWFGGKARSIRGLQFPDVIAIESDDCQVRLILAQIEYADGEPETYMLPLAFAEGELGEQILADSPHGVLARLEPSRAGRGCRGVIYDALLDQKFNRFLLDAIAYRRRFAGERGTLVMASSRAFRRVVGADWRSLEPVPLRVEQSNTSVAYGDRLILKLFRKLGDGLNPDLEVGRFLTEKALFPNTAPVAGALEYRRGRTTEPMVLGILQGYVHNEGDAWRYTLDSLARYFDSALSYSGTPELPECSLLELNDMEVPEVALATIEPYLASSRLLGQRTAELHLALSSEPTETAFAPEPFTDFYRRSLYQSMRNLTSQVFDLLQQRLRSMPEEVRKSAQEVLERRGEILERFQQLLRRRITTSRIRCHGDYHLGQVLYTGNDFVIIDFEGEPARSITERRLKRSPLRDVAGMVRSFHYAMNAALMGQAPIVIRPEDRRALEQWGDYWYSWVAATFVGSYLDTLGQATIVPQDREELEILLDITLLEKAVYEVGYELNNRPDWVKVPVQGILNLLGARA